MLVDPDVGLFRADERVFTAMLDGGRAQMLARGLTTDTIKKRCQLLSRFQEFTGEFPWQWRPVDIAARREADQPEDIAFVQQCRGDALRLRDAPGLRLGRVLRTHFRRHSKPDLLRLEHAHSYVTHLIEAGYDPAFVQTQRGHSYASTTGLYTSVSSDFKQKTVQKMIAHPIAT